MLLRFYPFVGIWRFDMMMYIDLMACIFWRCMTYIRCDCWEILYMDVVWILMWRRRVYFLNIYIIRVYVYYRFNRNRTLHYTSLDIIVVRKTSSVVSSAFYLCSDEWWWWDQCPRWRKDAKGHHRPRIGHDSCQNIFCHTPPWPIFDNIGWNIRPCAISSLYPSSFSG